MDKSNMLTTCSVSSSLMFAKDKHKCCTYYTGYTPFARIPRLHTRVSQGESAFAAGNARWTNLDLDPIAKNARKMLTTCSVSSSLMFAKDKHKCCTYYTGYTPFARIFGNIFNHEVTHP
jgi:hypothetical protein